MSIAIITIKAVDDAVRYLKSAFWQYGTNEAKYNFTRLEFKEVSFIWLLADSPLVAALSL